MQVSGDTEVSTDNSTHSKEREDTSLLTIDAIGAGRCIKAGLMKLEPKKGETAC